MAERGEDTRDGKAEGGARVVPGGDAPWVRASQEPQRGEGKAEGTQGSLACPLGRCPWMKPGGRTSYSGRRGVETLALPILIAMRAKPLPLR